METSLLPNNTQKITTLNGVLPIIRQLPSVDKLRLIRILAEELDKNECIFLFESDKVYHLPTPYNAFGAAEILMNALKKSDTDK